MIRCGTSVPSSLLSWRAAEARRQCDNDNAALHVLEGKWLRMKTLALGVVISDNAADDELSGNAADDGRGTCLAAMS